MAADGFYETLTAAVNDIAEHGYDSAERLEMWQDRIRSAAERSFTPPHILEQALRDTLTGIYRRMIEKGEVLRYHGGVDRFTVERLKPVMRAELHRRIMASADLIRLNREESIQKTLRRFSGWATSVPAGGAPRSVDRTEAKDDVRKALASKSFEERRVLIDQGHKLTSAINSIVATDAGAIAAEWHSHWRQRGYNYREDHRDRDEHVYLVRGSWAQDKGFVKPGPDGYTDQITQPGEEVYCRCYYRYVYSLRKLPKGMLTRRGAEALEDARQRIAA